MKPEHSNIHYPFTKKLAGLVFKKWIYQLMIYPISGNAFLSFNIKGLKYNFYKMRIAFKAFFMQTFNAALSNISIDIQFRIQLNP